MEKRLITSFLLSFVVLYIWSVFNNPATPPLQNQTLDTHISETAPSKDVSEPLDERPALKDLPPEENILVETDHLQAMFSNRGGNLEDLVFKKFNASLPIQHVINVNGYEKYEFKVADRAKNFVSYTYSDENIKIVKNYYFTEKDFGVRSEIHVTNISDQPRKIDLDIDAFIVDVSNLEKGDQRSQMLYEYSVAAGGDIFRKGRATKFSEKDAQVVSKSLDWMGFRSQYFSTIVKPLYEVNSYYIRPLGEKAIALGWNPGLDVVKPGQKVVLDSQVFFGPQDEKILASFNHGFEKIVDFSIGGFFDIFAFGQTDRIARLLLWVLQTIHKVLSNWGLSIIVFACFIYGITFPLTKKSLSSMRKMQTLQPELAKLKEKHKDDPQKLQQEMMGFYKKHNFNPLSGCFPIFLQMPIFVSLYQLLWRAYIFKGAGFLWIKDLSEPDRLFTLPFNIPYFGNEFNILPLIYGALMFLQQRLQHRNMPTSDPTQAEMQKMMAKMMPILLAVIFYKFASGLTLYFTIYYLLTTISQWKMSTEVKPRG